MLTERQRILRALADTAPPIIATIAQRERWCILASTVGLGALEHFGVEARPLATAAEFFNQEFLRWANGGYVGEKPPGAAGLRGWHLHHAATDPDPATPGYWVGHLVIDVPSERAIIDLDLRGIRNVTGGKIALPDAEVLIYEDKPLREVDFWINGNLLLYAPIEDDRWQHSVIWRTRRRGRCRRLILRTIAAMRARLDRARADLAARSQDG